MLVKVHVTKEDITQGNHRDSGDCMVYRAISRLLANDCGALVGVDDAIIHSSKFLPACSPVKFPPEVRLNIIKGMVAQRSNGIKKWFNRLPEPFEFEIDIPAKCLKIMPNFPDIHATL